MINRNQRKRKFLAWLNNCYQHRDPFIRQLLEYIASQPNLINYVIFSESVHEAPRGIYISYSSQAVNPFLYYKNKRTFTQGEQAFHDLRMSEKFDHEEYYVGFDQPAIYQGMYDFDVFQDNPYLQPDSALSHDIDKSLEAISRYVHRQQLKDLINEALDQQDYDKLNYYAGLWQADED